MKPMKPVTVEDSDLEKLRFPLYASIKCDGIRCVMVDGEPLSNTLKRIPNEFIYHTLKGIGYSLDGELLLENEDNPEQPGTHNFNDVQSAVMNKAGHPNFILWVFDNHGIELAFEHRNNRIKELFQMHGTNANIKCLPQILCNNLEELLAFEEWALTAGYEGIMLRSLTGTYKFGRSTFKEHFLLRRKPFVTEECRIIGFKEGKTNTNETYENELGYTKRSSAKEGLIPSGTLGGFIGYNKKWGQIELGSGKLKADEALHIFNNQAEFMNAIATFKYQACGSKDKPRILTFQHFRNPADMTPEQLSLL